MWRVLENQGKRLVSKISPRLELSPQQPSQSQSQKKKKKKEFRVQTLKAICFWRSFPRLPWQTTKRATQNNRHSFPRCPGGHESESKVSVGLVPCGLAVGNLFLASLPGSSGHWPSLALVYRHIIPISSFMWPSASYGHKFPSSYKDTRRWVKTHPKPV